MGHGDDAANYLAPAHALGVDPLLFASATKTKPAEAGFAGEAKSRYDALRPDV